MEEDHLHSPCLHSMKTLIPFIIILLVAAVVVGYIVVWTGTPPIENEKSHVNKRYGFSFRYPAVFDVISESSQRVIVGESDVEHGLISVTVEPTSFSSPDEWVSERNKELKERAAVEGHGLQSSIVIEKSIIIDGYDTL